MSGKALPSPVVANILSYLNVGEVYKCMQTCTSMKKLIDSDEALWKSMSQKYSTGEVTKLPLSESSWKSYCRVLVSKKYVRLVMACDATEEDIKYLILDVNLGKWRQVKSGPFVDWRGEDRRVRDFLKAHPGYVD
jgi:hypothetical protein